jgi:hypothetical protein
VGHTPGLWCRRQSAQCRGFLSPTHVLPFPIAYCLLPKPNLPSSRTGSRASRLSSPGFRCGLDAPCASACTVCDSVLVPLLAPTRPSPRMSVVGCVVEQREMEEQRERERQVRAEQEHLRRRNLVREWLRRKVHALHVKRSPHLYTPLGRRRGGEEHDGPEATMGQAGSADSGLSITASDPDSGMGEVSEGVAFGDSGGAGGAEVDGHGGAGAATRAAASLPGTSPGAAAATGEAIPVYQAAMAESLARSPKVSAASKVQVGRLQRIVHFPHTRARTAALCYIYIWPFHTQTCTHTCTYMCTRARLV